ncbi:MAG: hypothetical protein ABI333_12640 [bacterium]
MSSTFAELLAELVGQIPGAIGAVFLDLEGEAVDQFSHIPLFDILLVGAHWAIILRIVQEFHDKHSLGSTEVVILNGPEMDIIIKPIDGEYSVILAMKSGNHLASALTAIDKVASEIRAEM